MTSESATSQPWHVPEPSPWPIVGTAAALATALGLVWFMHTGSPWLLGIGGILVLWTMIGWWRQVILEANDRTSHTSPVKVGLRIGMLLFIASEVMFFFAFFWAFFQSSLAPVFNIGGVWPPKAIIAMNTYTIPLTNTFILLLINKIFQVS